jgi:hypothetical protein
MECSLLPFLPVRGMATKNWMKEDAVSAITYWYTRNITAGTRVLVDSTMEYGGMYQFIVHSVLREPATIRLMVNGVEVLSYAHHANVTYGSAMSNALVYLAQGDEFASTVECASAQSYRVYIVPL